MSFCTERSRRRGRLVEHDDLRIQDHGPGDGDALALAARELVRVAVAPAGSSRTSSRACDGAPVALGARDRGSWTRRPSVTISPTVMRGDSEP